MDFYRVLDGLDLPEVVRAHEAAQQEASHSAMTVSSISANRG